MGLFSDKKVVQVASVAYNMAGDLTSRVNVLKSTVSRHVLVNEQKVGLGERIMDVQLNGPTMDQRAWYRWAKNHYPVGNSQGRFGIRQEVDNATVQPFIPVPGGFSVVMDKSLVLSADIEIWAEQHILLTRPADFATNWIADYPSVNTLFIQYENLTTQTITITNYNKDAVYVVAYYRLLQDGQPLSTAAPRIHIYRIGTGNATLDALYVPGADQDDFFPAIPLRINNVPINHPMFAADYPQIARAYKKSMGEKIDKVLDAIQNNPNVGDIDYATVMFGVELTTQETCGLRYLYEFFRSLILVQSFTPGSFTSFLGTAAPTFPSNAVLSRPFKPEPRANVIRVNGTHPLMVHNDIRLNWLFIDETIHAGLGRPGAKPGDLWFQDRLNIVINNGANDGSILGMFFTIGYRIPHSRLFYQTGVNTFQVLDIYGMVHQNFVYGGVAVELSTSAALSGVDEEGFIVPLHIPTLKKLPLLMSNQLALSNRHVVMNCFSVVKVRWYQRGVFKILLGILISIVVAFVFPGAGGLLGSALNIGTSAGLTGASAIILGATVNAVAAMVLVAILEQAGAALFGEEFAAIFAVVASFFVMQAVGNWASGAGFTIDWGAMMRMDNLLGLLNSAIDAVGKWIQGELGAIQTEMGEASEQYERDLDALNKRAYELLGAGGGAIDPLMFTETQSRFYPAESRDAFLRRTLMTGSDLIDLSFSMIEDFVDLNLMLEKKIS